VAKAVTDIRSLARTHTAMCIRVLASIAKERNAPKAARVTAAGELLNRGWGKAPQAHTGENGEGDIKVTIRHILEHIDEKPVVIDGQVVEMIDATEDADGS